MKSHFAAIGLVFACTTVMALAYATWNYEYRAHVEAGIRSESRAVIQDLETRDRLTSAESSELARARDRLDALQEQQNRQPNSLWMHLPVGLVYWWPWVILTPLILALCLVFRFSSESWRSALSVHLLAGLIIGSGKTLIVLFLQKEMLQRGEVVFGAGNISIACSTYWTFVAAFNGLGYYRRYREREMRASRLEARLATAQLQMLRMQLQPHFLFNTLHAISTLMHRDAEAADRMISKLSELLRLSLEIKGPQEVPLRRELALLGHYLDIEKIRFDGRLAVSMDIPAETLDALVPHFILQPIVENAVNHGIGKTSEKGRIGVSAALRDGGLELEVTDNGPGISEADPIAGSRTGLQNTVARLSGLYGLSGRLEFDRPPRGGQIVRICIPFKTTAPIPDERNE
jgi:signal transduction histidine kinase